MNRLLTVDAGHTSLSRPVVADGEFELGELLPDPNGEQDDELLDQRLLADRIQQCLKSLDQRERQIILWRYGFDDGSVKSLQACGDEFGITRERVRQIERKALEKLRNSKQLRRLGKTFLG